MPHRGLWGEGMDTICALRVIAFAAMVAGNSEVALAQQGSETVPGDILVTAQKRSESVQDIPVSVTAISGETLASGGVKDLFQAVDLVPGTVFSRAPDDGLALTFRGLGTQARPQAFEQSVALFIDGIFLGKGRLYSTALFDIERLEFIKGTQSTLLGKNASVGAISVITRQPRDELSFEGRAGYEFENGGYTFDAASDLPLAEDLTLRVASHYNDLDGWVRNERSGHDGPEARDLGLRATLSAEPTGGPRLTASYQYADNRRIGTNYQIAGPADPALGDSELNGRLSAFTSLTSNGESRKRTRSHIANLKAEVDIGDNMLVSQSSYIRYKLGFTDDFDFSVFDSVNFLRNETYRQFTQEFRLQSPSGGTLEYMAGLFYLDSHWNSREQQLWAVPDFPPPPAPISGQLFNGPFINSFVQDQKAYSAFASATVRLSEALSLSGGLRWTRETKDIVYGRTNAPPLTIWNMVANPPFDPTPLGYRDSFIDGNVSVQYDLSDDVMAYAAYGHGSKSGGHVETNTITVPPELLVDGKVPADLVATGSRIKNEFTSTYEIGFKTRLLDRRLRFNIAGFHTDIKDFQDTVFTGGPLGFITFNGPVTSKGFEIEAGFRATPALQFDGGLTYADAKQKLQPIDASGTPVTNADGSPRIETFRRSQAPKLIFNIGATYETAISEQLNGRLTAGMRHRGAMYNQRQEQFRADALTTLDLGAGISAPNDAWGVELLAKNVTNAISADFGSPAVDPRTPVLAGPNQLRTIMLSAYFHY